MAGVRSHWRLFGIGALLIAVVLYVTRSKEPEAIDEGGRVDTGRDTAPHIPHQDTPGGQRLDPSRARVADDPHGVPRTTGRADTVRRDGRTATLRGVIEHGRDIEIVFVAGMNRATTIACDVDGRFESRDLFPGYGRLEVRSAGMVVAARPMLLRSNVDNELELDVAEPLSLDGVVVDESGEPLADARVLADGAETTTGIDGSFHLRCLRGGNPLVEVRCAGRARRELAAWRSGRPRIPLDQAGILEIDVPPSIGPSEVELYVAPMANRGGEHPWNRVVPIRCLAGRTVRLDDLPAGDVEVCGFTATAASGWITARVRRGESATITLGWEPLPMLAGIVHQAGKPLADVEVTVFVENPDEAVWTALTAALRLRRALPAEPLPAMRRRVVTDTHGRFELARPPIGRSRAWLEFRSSDREPVRRALDDVAELVIDLDR